MAHWLMKSEPGSYSWDDLVRDRSTEWDGVRNSTARQHLKAMNAGDEVFFYHSGEDRQIVGIMLVSRGPQPDPKDPAWVSVQVEAVRPLGRPFGPVTLKQIKAEPSLAKMELVRLSRLSVSPVREQEWDAILNMAGEKT